ncbi:MAG: hypothetical protein ACR2OB_03865, partial [Solirubrobacteraceae bacterium]
MTLVLHQSTASLSLANPLLPLARLATAPAARRYIAGWAGGRELHVLTPTALQARASNVPGSREMLALTAAALYTRRVIAENNHDLARARTPTPMRPQLRWARLLEGAARDFCGQTKHPRLAV